MTSVVLLEVKKKNFPVFSVLCTLGKFVDYLGNTLVVSTLNISQLFGGIDIDIDKVSFVRTTRLNWFLNVNRLDGKRKVSQVFNYNPQGSRLR
jgi:hypothetical protein